MVSAAPKSVRQIVPRSGRISETLSWSRRNVHKVPQPPAPTDNVKSQKISGVSIHDLFFEISAAIGYTYEIAETYLDDIEALVALWTKQGFIEVYAENADRQYGRVKDSNSAPNSSPWYIGLYHARLLPSGDNDPLVVIVFDKLDEENGEVSVVATLRFMLNHDHMFGVEGSREKFNIDAMRVIRKRIDGYIQQGNKQ